jgi:uncharacterized SAM-binding protein YcdF (DUF218 family)
VFERKIKQFRLLGLVSIALILLLLSMIPVRLAIAYIQSPQPQAILTLGGGIEREYFTAEFATQHPTLEVWVSTGVIPEVARPIYRTFGIPDERVNLDRRAVDTVTNFTSLVSDFDKRRIYHIYVITSKHHMARAKAIATIILGSAGIAFTPVSVPSGEPPESWLRILRDIGRAMLWILTGRTGASFNPRLEAAR